MMTDFISIVQNILNEQGKTVDELFVSNVISKNTFYKYRKRNPNLKTIIKIANYLQVSIDYMYEKSYVNNFRKYTNNQSNFYDNLVKLVGETGISNRKFCKDLNYSKDNILRYKNGVEPSLRTIIEISNYFNCSIDDLLTKQNKN